MQLDEEKEELMRQLLFIPCDTKEHLKGWINLFLGFELPDHTVCDDDIDTPPSNSNPLDLIWEVYRAAREGTDPTKSQYLFYASRDSFKSLSASIIEVLCLFHLDRDVAHLAAVVAQSKAVQRYLKNYLRRPVLRDFVTSKNEMTIEVTRYEKNGEILSHTAWKALSDEDKKAWIPKPRFVQIIVANLNGTNSLHCSMLILDELDLAPEGPVEEAMMIPSPGQERGELPMVLMTSSRKFGYGLVQKAIDEAEQRGINLRHWNLIDVAKPCPPARHLPQLPKIPIYYSTKWLRAVSEAEYQTFSAKEKESYKIGEGYAGCLSNCRLFSQCLGRLATKQQSSSPLLKSIDAVQLVFKGVSVERARSQLMCWVPSREGMIYESLDRDLHCLSIHEMARLVDGDEHPDTMMFQELVSLLRENDYCFFAGIDFGHTHCFAGVLFASNGHTAFFLDAFEVAELDTSQQIALCRERLGPYDPDIYPDTAYPGVIKDFKKRGFRMKQWKKYAGSVVDGIQAIRQRLRPIVGPPLLYMLKGNEGCELLYKRMAAYRWKLDSVGNPTDIPDDKDDDLMDAQRYGIMNVFGKAGQKIEIAAAETAAPPTVSMTGGTKIYDPKNWASQLISEQIGDEEDVAPILLNQPAPIQPIQSPKQLSVVPALAARQAQQPTKPAGAFIFDDDLDQ